MDRLPLTSDSELAADQTMNNTKVQLGEPMSFIGIIYSSMGESFTYSSRNDLDSCIIKALQNVGDSS